MKFRSVASCAAENCFMEGISSRLLPAAIAEEEKAEGESQDHCAAEGGGWVGQGEHR
jgi:hypothetical protein